MARQLQARPYVRQWLKDHGQEADVVARAIGLSQWAMYRRLRGEASFSLPEALAMAEWLRVDYETLFPGHSGVDPHDVEVANAVARGARTWNPTAARAS